MKGYLFFLLILTLGVSCKKKDCFETIENNSLDTIFPNEYLPAYPGSWWEYNDSVLIKTYDHWQEFTIEHTVQGKRCDYLVKDIRLVPVIDTDLDQYVLGNTLFRWEKGKNYAGYNPDILFNPCQKNWTSWNGPNRYYVKGGAKFSENNKSRRNITTESSMEVNSFLFENVKVIEEKWYDSGYEIEAKIVYYAQNIGIIQEINTYLAFSDTLTYGFWKTDTMEITDYFINH
ncbi:MAG: hypothetical protein AB8B74_02025 [Crocinitomicaceae bacterium]